MYTSLFQNEENCVLTSGSGEPVVCADGELLCDGSLCIREALVCDTKHDCADGRDERDCSKDDSGSVSKLNITE